MSDALDHARPAFARDRAAGLRRVRTLDRELFVAPDPPGFTSGTP